MRFVLGLLAWIFFAALGVVVGVEINVVRAKGLYPRALLTPFTDNVDLTTADRRSYTDAAVAQRHKGFEQIVVTFHPRPVAGEDDQADDGAIEGDGDPPPVTDASATDEPRPDADAGRLTGREPHDR